MKKVIIGSKNPVKIEATKRGFERMFPGETFVFQGLSVPSGVADQPMSSDETLQGALNRANNAKESVLDADFRVGIEGGLEKLGDEMQAFAWIYIRSTLTQRGLGKAKTATFFLPQAVVSLVDLGYELGVADDMVFGKENSKQSNGAVGLLTGDCIDRTSYYENAVVLALIPFKNPELYG